MYIRYRNIGAFVNHQCCGSNLVRRKVFVHHSDTRVWRLGLFACVDIEAGVYIIIFSS